MALNNIFREPRREITETIVGGVIIGACLGGDYLLGRWIADQLGHDLPVAIGMLLGAIAATLAVLGLFLAHWLGEDICDRLEDRGIRLRPRRPESQQFAAQIEVRMRLAELVWRAQQEGMTLTQAQGISGALFQHLEETPAPFGD